MIAAGSAPPDTGNGTPWNGALSEYIHARGIPPAEPALAVPLLFTWIAEAPSLLNQTYAIAALAAILLRLGFDLIPRHVFDQPRF